MAQNNIEKLAIQGVTSISTANPNRDGSGSLSNLYTSNNRGTWINFIVIKATGTTSLGVIRFFIRDSLSNINLFKEINVIANEQSSVSPSFQYYLPLNIFLSPDYSILVSTEKAESFNVFLFGEEWQYPSSASSIENKAISSMAIVNTSNSSLDGSGALAEVVKGDSIYGTIINRIDVKAIGDTSQGMIRLFIEDDSNNKKVLWEVKVPCNKVSSINQSFSFTMFFDKGLFLKENWIIKASTQKSEDFNIIAFGESWNYV
jgi:hypothetical protein